MLEDVSERPRAKPAIEKVLRQVEAQGARVRPTRGGHWVVYPADRSHPPIYMSGTPSDHRALKNWKAHLRRSGFTID